MLADEDSKHRLQLVLDVLDLDVLVGAEQDATAHEVYQTYLWRSGQSPERFARMIERLHEESDAAMEHLANELVSILTPKAFLDDDAQHSRMKLADSMLMPIKDSLKPASMDLLWANCRKTPEVHGWLVAFLTFADSAETLSLTLSDMTVPGNPLVYVNDEFCATTGYTREECLGRNCRFLQGPRSDADSISTIRDAMRIGSGAPALSLPRIPCAGSWIALFLKRVQAVV